jgi:hypothetical protein
VRGQTNSPAHAAVSAVNDHGGFGIWSRASISGHFEGTVQISAPALSDALQVTGDTNLQGRLVVNPGRSLGSALLVVGTQAENGTAATFEGGMNVNGNITVSKDFDIVLSAAADCAEAFPAARDDATESGTVVVVDDNGEMQPCQKPYDRRVAGVVSGARGLRPGIILGTDLAGARRALLALTGRVFAKVDASLHPVESGDLLTTSPTPGHAMKAADPTKAFGAVIGKALRPLPAGQGLVPILIALQ